MKVTELLANYVYDIICDEEMDYLTETVLTVHRQIEIEYLRGAGLVCDYKISHDITKDGTYGCKDYAPTGYESSVTIDEIVVQIYAKNGIYLENVSKEVNEIIYNKLNK